MIVQCTRCLAKFRFDESKLAGVVSKKLKCTKCSQVFTVMASPAIEKAVAQHPLGDAPPEPSRIPTGEFIPLDGGAAPPASATPLEPFQPAHAGKSVAAEDPFDLSGESRPPRPAAAVEKRIHSEMYEDSRPKLELAPQLDALTEVSFPKQPEAATLELETARQFDYGAESASTKGRKVPKPAIRPLSGGRAANAPAPANVPLLVFWLVRAALLLAMTAMLVVGIVMVQAGDRFNPARLLSGEGWSGLAGILSLDKDAAAPTQEKP
ncbi:MAG: hypothetical protein C4523_03890 [Myxococcales bacterium]|nr:MAG: hypothetical protein C4523_03890 [Myxococcales bacterium]